MNVEMERSSYDISDLFKQARHQEGGFLRVSAPMVRYSKLEFRRLLRQNGVELCFTPMIVADSFISSEKARQNEFTTTNDEGPLIAQFAANNAYELLHAAELICPYVDGIDLNCGCPQSWAISKGYGCALLKQPEHVHDMIRNIRRILPKRFSISVKMRLLNNKTNKDTVQFARQLEKCGITFISLHGRTMWQRTSEPINVAAIQEVKDALQIPLIANGNIRTWEDACELYEKTQADGIMVGRGLLSNPSLFNPDFKYQPNVAMSSLHSMLDWLTIAYQANDNIQFQCFHHHLIFMLSNRLGRHLRKEFNSFTKKEQIFDFFRTHYNLEVISSSIETIPYIKCAYRQWELKSTKLGTNLKTSYEAVVHDNTVYKSKLPGKYFTEFCNQLKERKENDFVLEDSFLLNLM